MKINIAIDGPSAAGKSTVAKHLAKTMNYVHLDTGAMYRCVAYKALSNKIDLQNEVALVQMLMKTTIELTSDGKVILDGKDVSSEIRLNEVSMNSSIVSAHVKVREYLVKLQQDMAKSKGVIMDGRDIGTVVLKDAECKIFLVASPETRALRRHKENIEKSIKSDLNQIKREIIARDYQDMNRKYSPLTKASDAIEVDASNMSVNEVADTIFNIVKRILKEVQHD